MLIYARKESIPRPPVASCRDGEVGCSSQTSNALNPPARALNVVKKINSAYDEACEAFTQRSLSF